MAPPPLGRLPRAPPSPRAAAPCPRVPAVAPGAPRGPPDAAAVRRASFTACLIAALVTLAPDTPSMSAPWAASICWAKVPSSMASLPPIPGVSLLGLMSVTEILPPLTSIVTLMSPPMPLPVPV